MELMLKEKITAITTDMVMDTDMAMDTDIMMKAVNPAQLRNRFLRDRNKYAIN